MYLLNNNSGIVHKRKCFILQEKYMNRHAVDEDLYKLLSNVKRKVKACERCIKKFDKNDTEIIRQIEEHNKKIKRK